LDKGTNERKISLDQSMLDYILKELTSTMKAIEEGEPTEESLASEEIEMFEKQRKNARSSTDRAYAMFRLSLVYQHGEYRAFRMRLLSLLQIFGYYVKTLSELVSDIDKQLKESKVIERAKDIPDLQTKMKEFLESPAGQIAKRILQESDQAMKRLDKIRQETLDDSVV